MSTSRSQSNSSPAHPVVGDNQESSPEDEEEEDYQDLEEEEIPLHYSVSGLDRAGIVLLGCRYDVILRVALESRFKVMSESEPWSLCWSDMPLLPEKIVELKQNGFVGGPECPRIQKFNHFPSMYEICRKDRLGRNLNRFKRLFPKDFNFYPSTWDLPTDLGELTEWGKKHPDAIFIVKPDSGCQGKGIFLCNDLSQLNPFVKCVCQLYIPQPLLLDGFKFDLRIYVLITSVDPLRIYVYKDGLARFATLKYQVPDESNLDLTYMHLTNYSLNKFSEGFDADEDGGTKRPVSDVYTCFAELGYDVVKLEKEIDSIIIKSVVAVAPALRHGYRATFSKRERGCLCFELLGFDILIDQQFKPLLIEINASPSFNLDTPADSVVKVDLIRDLFAMLHIDGDSPPGSLWKAAVKEKGTKKDFNIQRRPGTAFATSIPDTLKDQFVHEDGEKNRTNFRLIFTEDKPGRYAKYLDQEYCLLQDKEDSDRAFFAKKKESLVAATPKKKVVKRVKTLLRPPPGPSPRGRLFQIIKEESKEELATPLPEEEESDKEEEPLDLSPSERVAKALERLRKKNKEKFKRLTELNRDVLKLDFNPIPAPVTPPTPPPPEKEEEAIKSSKNKKKKRGGRKSGRKKKVNEDESMEDEEPKGGGVLEEGQDQGQLLPLPAPTTFRYSVRALDVEPEIILPLRVKLPPPSGDHLPQRCPFPCFTPQTMDMSEERRRIRGLASRKRAIGILGVAEIAREVVEMVAAGNGSSTPPPPPLTTIHPLVTLDGNANQGDKLEEDKDHSTMEEE